MNRDILTIVTVSGFWFGKPGVLFLLSYYLKEGATYVM